MDQLQLQIARKVMPSLPAQLRGWGVAGGSFSVHLEGVSEAGLLSARMPSAGVREGMRLVLPINGAEGGGYDIICEIVGRFFISGLETAVELHVTRVERRKPYRAEARAPLNELCLVRLASLSGSSIEFEGKVVDMSTHGLGMTTDRRLQIGDQLEVAWRIANASLRCSLIVIHTETIPFGRYRSGCRIASVSSSDERLIRDYLVAHGNAAGTPELRRTTISHVA